MDHELRLISVDIKKKEALTEDACFCRAAPGTRYLFSLLGERCPIYGETYPELPT